MARNIEARMPTDLNGTAIQVLSVDQTTAKKITVSSTSDGVELDSTIDRLDVVRVACTIDAYIEFGFGSEATADTTSVLMPAGVEYFRIPTGATHLSAIRVGSVDGVLDVAKAV